MSEATPYRCPFKLAFISPQGTLVLKDNTYLKRQGSTAEEGGQVTYVVEMARALAKRRGNQVDIFARNYDNVETVRVEIDPDVVGVRVIHVPTHAPRSVQKENFHFYYPEYLARLIQHVDDNDNDTLYDCIVGHYADGMLLAVALERHLAVTKKRPTPVMGVTHSLTLGKVEWSMSDDGQPLLASGWPDSVARRLACEMTALTCLDGVVALSDSQRRLLAEGYSYPSNQPIAIVPGGVDEKVFYRMPSLQRHDVIATLARTNKSIPQHVINTIQNGRLVFGYGRMVESKGLVNAVKAMGHLLRRHPETVYVYAGGNPESGNAEERSIYEACTKLARAGDYSSRVVFIGHRDQRDIAHWLNVADVYLHCATTEPYGLAPLEAVSCGAPVVLSTTAGVAEFLVNGTDALHLDPNSPEDIADKLGQVLDDCRVPFGMVQRYGRFLPKVASWRVRGDQMLSYLEEWFMPDCLARRAARGVTGGSLGGNRQCLLDAFAGYGGDQAMRAVIPRLEEARAILIQLVGGEALGQINEN